MVDGKQLFTRSWFLFLQELFTRSGGVVVSDEGDDALQDPIDAGSAAMQLIFQTFREGIDQRPIPDVYSTLPPVDDVSVQLSMMRDEISELRKIIDSLQQGNLII